MFYIQVILGFRASPPAMIATKVSDGNRHVINDSVGKFVSPQEKVCTVRGFAQYVGNSVGLYKFSVIVGVVVYVLSGVGGRHHSQSHKGKSLCLGFLQVVSGIVPAALQCTFFRCKFRGGIGNDVYHFACTVFGVARSVEPRLGITATLDT